MKQSKGCNRKYIAVVCSRYYEFKNYITELRNYAYYRNQYLSKANLGGSVELGNFSFWFINRLSDIRGKRFHDIVHIGTYLKDRSEIDYYIKKISLSTYHPSPIHCAFCKRIHGNVRKNTTIIDELRGVEYETGPITIVKYRQIKSVCGDYDHEVHMCQSCELRFAVHETQYVLVEFLFVGGGRQIADRDRREITTFKFLRKNETPNRFYNLYELSDTQPLEDDESDNMYHIIANETERYKFESLNFKI
jgi:hypothetical protein